MISRSWSERKVNAELQFRIPPITSPSFAAAVCISDGGTLPNAHFGFPCVNTARHRLTHSRMHEHAASYEH